MKVLLFSDLHIHDYKSHSKNFDRLENCLKVLSDLEKFCTKYDIDVIWFGGDLFDTFQVLMSRVVNDTVSRFKQIFESNKNLKIYAITGNHDQSSKNLIGSEAGSSLEYLHTIFPDNFIIIDNIKVTFDGNVTLSGIPYYEYPEHFYKKLDERVKDLGGEHNYLMIHQTPKGIGNEMIPVDCFPSDKRFAKFDRVFCGHIHKRQQLTDNFEVIGSPIHRDLGDKEQTKGFYVINTVKPEKGCKFFPLEGYPEFIEKCEDDITEEDLQSGNFIIRKHEITDSADDSEIQTKDFSTAVKTEDLVENYWKQVDGKNKDLLKTGLKFI